MTAFGIVKVKLAGAAANAASVVRWEVLKLPNRKSAVRIAQVRSYERECVKHALSS